MASGAEIRGLDNLVRLSRALRAAGEQGKGLRKELRSGIVRETKHVRAEMKEGMKVGPALPSRGGLARDIQDNTRFTTAVNNRGVSIRVVSKRSIRRMNAIGTFRHPVFGNRGVWVEQSAGVSKGFLDRPFEKSRPEVQKAVLAAIDRVRAQVYRKA
jgi:hypothetical protein